ncbi:unnamed protein product [Clavelina lepadiformis]|uniref:Uncharacterized protein n=1 Tax=Clavelina lepadiformis TaxID=159417 RepID=A0ABP0G9R4_CLALP
MRPANRFDNRSCMRKHSGETSTVTEKVAATANRCIDVALANIKLLDLAETSRNMRCSIITEIIATKIKLLHLYNNMRCTDIAPANIKLLDLAETSRNMRCSIITEYIATKIKPLHL